LHQRLDARGIPHLHVDYGPGAHTWPYSQDDLAATLPSIAAFFARAQELPLAA
jgi:S-formylglutathione hydrolase FrmB